MPHAPARTPISVLVKRLLSRPRIIRGLTTGLLVALPAVAPAQSQDAFIPPPQNEAPRPTAAAQELISAAIDQTRGRTSYAEMEMEVHRPDWSRTSAITAWTRGREDALIRFTGPPRDAGNATLKDGEQMWTFTPRLNRVVRLPYSMMSQSWAGSDFSYDDLSRTDALLKHYQHEMIEVREENGLRVYTVDSIPNADAPVVWGRQRLVMREDFVVLAQTFFDQEGVALKRMETLEIASMGGRLIPSVMRMWKLDETEHWTEVRYRSAEFDVDIPDRRFTLFALRNQEG